MNFIDMAFLGTENIVDGRLKYSRRKTNKKFDIKINKEGEDILKYYLKEKRTGNLVFPIMDDVINTNNEEYIFKTYKNRLKTYNKYLNKLALANGINTKLTSYVSRHSFASIGRTKGVSKSFIGDMLGHSSYTITEAYFAELDHEVLDDAADKIFL